MPQKNCLTDQETEYIVKLPIPERKIMRMILRNKTRHHTIASLTKEYPRVRKRSKGSTRKRGKGVTYQYVWGLVKNLKEKEYISDKKEIISGKIVGRLIAGRAFDPYKRVISIPPQKKK